jgi:hypothetical protein
MPAVLARDIVPSGQILHHRRLLESAEKRASVHVFAHRQALEDQQRRRDIEHAGAVEQFVLLQSGSANHQDPEVAVLGGGAGRNRRE